MPVPDFSPGEVLTAAAMDSIGLWLVKTQTIGTAVSSVTVTDAFSADYDNYKIMISGGQGSASTNLRYNNTGSTTQYYSAGTVTLYSTKAVAGFSTNNASSIIAGSVLTSLISCDLTVINPFLAKDTLFSIGQVVFGADAGTGAAIHSSAVSYTGFTLAPQSGTFTGGTIRVYGYRN